MREERTVRLSCPDFLCRAGQRLSERLSVARVFVLLSEDQSDPMRCPGTVDVSREKYFIYQKNVVFVYNEC